MKSATRLIICIILMLSVLLTSCGTGRQPDESNDASNLSDISDVSETGGGSSADESSTAQSSMESSVAEEPQFLRSGLYFKDIAYETPDFEEIYDKIASIQALYENETDAEEIKTEFESLDDLMWFANTAYGLLNIMQSLDTTDTEISDELVLLSENFTNAEKYYYNLANTLLDSYCADVVFRDATRH
ncbi:hypothetical protein EOM82_09745, partial [bacterium]|nr:hypothetical protein [bacterium]